MKRMVTILATVLAACGPKGGAAPAAEAPQPAETEAAAGVEKPTEWKLEGMTLVLPGPVTFEGETEVLAADAEAALVTMQSYLEAKADITMMRIEGHVRGMGEAGQGLSERRALAVTAWLVGKGIACGRLLPVGFGEHKPAFGDERDTRIEAVNAALRGRAIGGMPVDGGGLVAGDPCR
jgi:OOP family OmpA-OmpF porin